jgi:ubiquinone/menaquinone biosynthesis C-methylase UbiE
MNLYHNLRNTMSTTSECRFRNRGAENISELIQHETDLPFGSILVVGCGSGIEAAVLAHVFSAKVWGIDLHERFDPQAAKVAELRQGDATALEFDDCRFDLVYSYHALEHIFNYKKALEEMRRVLKVGCFYCVGTPNRSRLIGYVGSKQTSIAEKIRWNYVDWKAKLTGRFRNELGAHAGFTRKHLTMELQEVFGNVKDVSLTYYLGMYSRYGQTIRFLDYTGLSDYVFPSIYFIGKKYAL